MKALLVVLMTFGLMACDKKKDSQPNMRGAFQQRQPFTDGQGNIVPGGNPLASQQCPDCGHIYSNGNMRNIMLDFLLLNDSPNELGEISGRPGGNTGVLFRGNVDSNAQSGYVEIIVWDSEAARTGEAYVVRMEVDSGNPNNYVDNNSGAAVTFRDQFGDLSFNGQWYQDGTYQGNVQFQNGNAYGSQSMGNFITGAFNFIR